MSVFHGLYRGVAGENPATQSSTGARFTATVLQVGADAWDFRHAEPVPADQKIEFELSDSELVVPICKAAATSTLLAIGLLELFHLSVQAGIYCEELIPYELRHRIFRVVNTDKYHVGVHGG